MPRRVELGQYQDFGAGPFCQPLTQNDCWTRRGEEIFVRYKGDPSKERYEFIRDYLDFKVKRIK